jgi:hypothetical protein
VISEWWNRFNYQLTRVCLADCRNSRFDGYTVTLIVILVMGLGVIYI